MGKPLSVEKRGQIIGLRKMGKSLTTISEELAVSYTAVQALCARYASEGEQGLLPRYENCGKKRPTCESFVYRAVRCLRSWHPGWGAGKIRAELLRLRPGLALPKERTIQRWFHWNAQAHPPSKLVKRSPHWAKASHQGWQIDGKEAARIKDGSIFSWLTVIDEHSGGFIDAGVFPLR
jgi:hypothetical protein